MKSLVPLFLFILGHRILLIDSAVRTIICQNTLITLALNGSLLGVARRGLGITINNFWQSPQSALLSNFGPSLSEQTSCNSISKRDNLCIIHKESRSPSDLCVGRYKIKQQYEN